MAKYFAVSVRKSQSFNNYFSDTARQMECVPSLVPIFSIQPLTIMLLWQGDFEQNKKTFASFLMKH